MTDFGSRCCFVCVSKKRTDSCGASESRPKGTEIAGPLRPVKVWDPAS